MNHLFNNHAHQESCRPQIFDCQYNQTNQELATSLPVDMILLLRRKAERLLAMPNDVCSAQGMSNGKCIASESGEKPHIVTKSQSKHKEGAINCDDACLGWKSQRICAHVYWRCRINGMLG